jgi:hypothetical protein
VPELVVQAVARALLRAGNLEGDEVGAIIERTEARRDAVA